jgi:X-X-X-Leu-X-X-Gly heptad repeat protein
MSDEDSMVSKILGTGFGVLTVMGAYYWQTAYFSLRANTANGLNELAASGTELAAGTQQFVANFATGNAVTSPGAPVIVFDLIVLAMIVGQIWMPKKG